MREDNSFFSHGLLDKSGNDINLWMGFVTSHEFIFIILRALE